jgi:hypothetical protein
MGSFNLGLTKEIAPAEIFAEMPQSFRQYISRGFGQLAEIEPSKVAPLVSLLAEGLNAADETGAAEIVRRLDLPVREKGSFGGALGLLVVFVTSRDDFNDIILAGAKAGAIPDATVGRIGAIARELEKSKAALTEVVESSSLANEVAPSFQRLDIAVDLRLRLDDGKVSKSVPVAICHLDTDSRDGHCFFQMKKSDVSQLIVQLQKIEAQLNAAEAWARERR